MARRQQTNVTGSAGFTHTYQQAGGFTITASADRCGGNTGVASDAIVIDHAPLPTVTVDRHADGRRPMVSSTIHRNGDRRGQ